MRLKLTLDDALTEYQKKTKQNLLDYWLATELKSCESIDAVLGILRDQAEAIERTSAGDQRLMKHIGSSVNVLSSISDTLGEGISLVSIKNLFFFYNSDVIVKAFPAAKVIFAGFSVLLSVRIFPGYFSESAFIPNFDRRQRESKPATMRSPTYLGASKTSSSALIFISKVRRPPNCWKYL